MSDGDPKLEDLNPDRVGHEGKQLTTDQGVPIEHTDDSLSAGERGPTLIEDFHFPEKLIRRPSRHVARRRERSPLAADGVDAASLRRVVDHLVEQGAICEVLAPHGGELDGALAVDRPLQTMASVLYDAVLVAGGEQSVGTLRRNGGALRYVSEAFKHAANVNDLDGFSASLADAISTHRHFDRRLDPVPA